MVGSRGKERGTLETHQGQRPFTGERAKPNLIAYKRRRAAGDLVAWLRWSMVHKEAKPKR
ncbi:hypothetical protein BZL30_5224 [Mycobacterium kansasii]|uniref:Uncharacterized protein n=1 Tax=Mycobacterium kansasii TaxID=1768 RepID=A0A1V3X3T4_MYCKA|nr:hypothetical protein BZL30_5224 [Mycobacterium kansasii]